jgi:hypothetical protein
METMARKGITGKTTTLLVGLFACALAAAKPLKIILRPPNAMDKVGSGYSTWTIFLDGEIDSGADARFNAGVEKLHGDRANVYFNSPGGNLFAGLNLGETIRKHGFSTYIGRRAEGMRLPRPAECLSACTFAYLGGVYRYADPKSRYGMHRATTAANSSADFDVGHLMTGRVAQYVHEMGGDESLVTIYESVSKDNIFILSPQEMVKLKVVNNGRLPADWSVKSNESGPYLLGMQQTAAYGLAKAEFSCKQGGVVFLSIYEAPKIAEEVAKGTFMHSLLLDNKVVPLPTPQAFNDKGYINAVIPLTDAQARLLERVKQVGHAMRVAREAPTYVGYKIDIDAGARRQIVGFVEDCLSQKAPSTRK